MKTYEVELRALLSKEKYDELLKHFEAITPGEKDDMATWAFLGKDYNIKVKNMITKRKAKITAKNGAEHKQDVQETELVIQPEDVEKAVAFISAIGYNKHVPSFQKRTNYKVDDMTISLKDETHWGPHIEVELVVDSPEKIPAAKEQLRAYFASLRLKELTEEDTRALTNSALKKFGLEPI